jgi:hypothetical protein
MRRYEIESSREAASVLATAEAPALSALSN